MEMQNYVFFFHENFSTVIVFSSSFYEFLSLQHTIGLNINRFSNSSFVQSTPISLLYVSWQRFNWLARWMKHAALCQQIAIIVRRLFCHCLFIIIIFCTFALFDFGLYRMLLSQNFCFLVLNILRIIRIMKTNHKTVQLCKEIQQQHINLHHSRSCYPPSHGKTQKQ